MNFIVDGIIAALVVGCCIWGFKNGFVEMVVNFCKNILAMIIAGLFTKKVGLLLYKHFFKDLLEDFTIDKIAKWLGVDTSENMDIGPLLDAEHSEFFKFIEKHGYEIGQISEKYDEVGANAGDLMIEYIAKPLGTAVSNVVAFILLFILASFVISIVGIIIGNIAKLPVLNVTNRLLGMVLGLCLGVLFAFLVASLVSVIVPLIKIHGENLNAGVLEEGTILYKYLIHNTPSNLVEDFLELIGVI